VSWRIAFLACGLILFGTACKRGADLSSKVTIYFEITPQPPRVGPVGVVFVIKDAATLPITKAKITAEADMSHPGMSPVFADVREVSPGRYESQMNLAMAGDWVILLHGTLPDGSKLERQFDVRAVRPN
jgi:hypothetical protein